MYETVGLIILDVPDTTGDARLEGHEYHFVDCNSGLKGLGNLQSLL